MIINKLQEAMSKPDARTGLGFGTMEPTFHGEKEAGGSFPYIEDDPYKDAPDADELDVDAVTNKGAGFIPSDSFHISSRANPNYFSEGSDSLCGCFWDCEQVIMEMANYDAGVSASGGVAGSNYKRTGSLRGWASAPPESFPAAEENSDDFENEEHIYSVRDLVKNEDES